MRAEIMTIQKLPLKRKILKSVAHLEKSGVLGAALAKVLFRFSKFSSGCAGAYAEGADEILAPLREKKASHVVRPRKIGETKSISVSELGPLTPFVFRDARVNGASSVVVTRNGAFVPQMYHDHRSRIYPTPETLYQVMEVDDRIITRQQYSSVIEKGICVFGSGAFNWFHWLIEAVPRAILAQGLPSKYDSYPLLVPMSCREGSSFEAALKPFAGTREIIRIPDIKTTLVRELIQIEPPTFAPAHVRNNAWPEPQDYRQDIAFFQLFRQRMLEVHQIKPGKGPKRLFLARARSQSELERDFNQDELLRIAETFGFMAVQPERLSLREQLQLYYDADFVIGPSGAAWTNTLFCKAGTRGLNWALSVYDGACVFSNFSEVSGIEIFHFFVEPDQPVANSDEAFRAHYKVDPKVFEREMIKLMADAEQTPVAFA